MYKMQGVGSNNELFLPRRGKGLFSIVTKMVRRELMHFEFPSLSPQMRGFHRP